MTPDLFLIVAAMLSLGLLVGFFSGLLGIGGGLLMVPAIHFLLSQYGYSDDVTVHVAIGTSMAVIVPTAIASARGHAAKGAVDRQIFMQLAPGIVMGVVAGAAAAHVMAADIMKIVFAVVAVVVAIILTFDPAKYRLGDQMPSRTVNSVVGMVFGFCASLMGVAGGAMNVPYMALYGVPIHRAVGTAAALGVALSVPAMMGYILIGYGVSGLPPLSLGYVNLGLFALLLPGSVFMAPYGVRLAHRLPVHRLRQFFAIFILLVVAKMVL